MYPNNESIQTQANTLELGSQQFPIAAASAYYLKQDHTVTRKHEFLKQFFLLVVCVSGAFLYWIPAGAYAKRVDETDNTWRYQVGTCIPALAVLYVATDTFFKVHFGTQIPDELDDVLVNPQTRAQRYTENAAIFLVAAISALCLAAVIFTFPPSEKTKFGYLIALAVIILIDNTVLHFLPVKLILNKPVYRFPFLPFELAYVAYRDRNLSSSDKMEQARQAQVAADRMQLKQLLIGRITLAQQRLTKQSFTWNCRGYNVDVPKSLRHLKNADDPLQQILSILPEVKEQEQAASSPTCLSRLNEGLRKLIVVAGAIWIWSCCTGYYADPVNELYKLTGDYRSAGPIAALPIYTLSVLLAFFGELFLGGLYAYATNWGKDTPKIPMEVKLYPKVFLLLMAVNAACTPYSFAAAAELVYKNFTGDFWQPFVPYLVGAAKSGIAFVSFLATRDFFMLMLLKWGSHLGGEQSRLVAKTNEQIDQFKNSINLMDGEKLERELSAMTPDERQQLLGVSDKKYQQIINHEANFSASSSVEPSTPWWSCFGCGGGAESDPLLGTETQVNGGLAY